ncbi:barstar family protein [Rhodococcus sp. 27YEA15]|uniref:barstar family protein n=1 Tax=Rhodococcus sp. 27YEA15 TaxID=3156259 RepID=UPI003C79D669
MAEREFVTLEQWLDPSTDTTSVALVGAADRGDELARQLRLENFVVRAVRGARMRTTTAVFDEFAAAFQFPAYFGRNKDAFDDVMRDLDDVLGLGAGYVLVVRDADALLSDQSDQRSWFRETMDFYAQEWSPVVFRTVYQFESGSCEPHVGDLMELHYPDTAPQH